MKRFNGVVLATIVIAVSAFSNQSRAENYVEPGRFGVEGIVTANTFQGGVIYVNDWLDAAVDFNAEHYKFKFSADNTAEQKNNIGLDGRLGKRFNVGNYNYLTAGLQYSMDLGSHDGIDMGGSYSVGPYIGLQRHFPGTGIMLTVFIYPYAHSVANTNDGEGGHLQTTSDTFMANGGFGIAYLF